MNEEIFCCTMCLPVIIAQDKEPKTVRFLDDLMDRWEAYCRCGKPATFALSK